MPNLIRSLPTTTANLTSDDEYVRDLVTRIARALVDADEAVTVELSEQAGMVTLRLRAARSDIGKLIGQQGRTARSLRTIMAAVGSKLSRRYALNIEDDKTDAPNMAQPG